VTDAATTTERIVTVNGVDLRVIDSDPDGLEPEAPLVVLCHGFPELAYSWRHQIPALVRAGYRVIAPDQRGYGGSTRPAPVEDYDIVHLTDDILGLVDEAGAEQAVVVGHDWGAMVAWGFARRHPGRTRGVVGMSVAFTPRPSSPPVETMRALFQGMFFYVVYFQEPGVADADLNSDPAGTMRGMLAGLNTTVARENQADLLSADDGRGFVERLATTAPLPDWLQQSELDHYIAEFARTGFTGGINWYRNFDRNWKLDEALGDTRITVPALFITGAADPVRMMTPPTGMDGWVTDLRDTVVVAGAGHWVQQEKPDEVNEALLTFLRAVAPPPTS
jgi:pimeloyl-ACP methyl ester carboxylesterase